MAITQQRRIFAVNTPLGEDVLVFYHMIGTEQLGRLFEYEIELLSEKTYIQLTEILGKNITVRMQLPEARGAGTRRAGSRSGTRTGSVRGTRAFCPPPGSGSHGG